MLPASRFIAAAHVGDKPVWKKMLRRWFLIIVLVVAGLCCGGPALAISAMDPFNVPATFDPGAVLLGQGIAYGDNPRQMLDVYTPQNPDGNAPVLVFIYGGGWNRGERGDYAYLGQAMASQGFVTVIIDYRLVPEVAYPAFVQDCALAVKWVDDHISRYGGNPDKLYLMGHSAGAYNAIMLGLDPSFLKEAGVTHSIKGIAALSGPYDFYPFDYDEVRNAFGAADTPQLTQPINLVTKDAPPIFLGTGTSDPIVQPVNSDGLTARLKDAGTIVFENRYEGLGHMEPILVFSTLWRWRAPVMEDVIGFFSDLGAFADGEPRPSLFPQAVQPEGDRMQQIVTELDGLFSPIDAGP